MTGKITPNDIALLFLLALTGTEKQKNAATKLLALIHPCQFRKKKKLTIKTKSAVIKQENKIK